MPENRLELSIEAIDNTGSATASARANFLSIEQEAARMAASANASIASMERRLALLGTSGGERIVVERALEMQKLRGAEADQLETLGNQYNKLYNIQQQGHVRALEQRAAFAGKSAAERIAMERDIALHKTATDNLLQSYAQNAERIAAARAVITAPRARGATGQFLPRSAEEQTAYEDARRELAAAQTVRRQLRPQLAALRPAEDVSEAGLAAREAAAYNKLYSTAKSAEAVAAIQREEAAVKNLTASLTSRGAVYGKTGADKLIAEQAILEKQWAASPVALGVIRTEFGKMIKAAEAAGEGGGHFGSTKPIVLGVKDALEGNFRYAEIEGVNFIRTLSGIQLVGGIAAGSILGLGVAALGSFKSLADLGEHINNVSLKTGLSVKEVQSFGFAAESVGQDVGVFDKLMRGLSQAADENSQAGKRGRQELSLLGVNLRDVSGTLKPTGTVILELADAFNKLPPGMERDAAALEIIKRSGVEAIPVLETLRSKTEEFQANHLGVSEQDVARFREYNDMIKLAGAQWELFLLQVKKPLASIIYVSFKFLNGMDQWLAQHAYDLSGSKVGGAFTGEDAKTLGNIPDILNDKNVSDEVKNRLRQRSLALPGQKAIYDELQERIENYEQDRNASPDLAVQQARKARQLLPAPEAIRDERTFDKVKAADAALDAAEAAKQSAQLDTTLAQTRLRDQEKIIRETIGNKALPSDADIATLRELADNAARAEANKNPRTAAQTLPKLQQIEQLKVDEQLDAQRASYERRRHETAIALGQQRERAEQEHRDHLFQSAELGAKQERDLAIEQLGLIDAQTIRQKIDLEEQKLAIERTYAARSLDIQIRKLETDRDYAVRVAKQNAEKQGYKQGDYAYDQAGAAEAAKSNDQIAALRDAARRKDQIDTQAAANTKTKLLIEENKKVFSAIKSDTDKFYSALFDKSQNLGDVLKNILKSAILTPIKEIASNQTANLLTELFTGQKATFGGVGSGQGRLGPFGDLLGRLGLGPRIVANNVPNINAPNHLGEVELIGKAVPVYAVNLPPRTPFPNEHADQAFRAAQVLLGTGSAGRAPEIPYDPYASRNPLVEQIIDKLPTLPELPKAVDKIGLAPTVEQSLEKFGQHASAATEAHKSLKEAIATYEGFYSGNTLAQRNNNPGNIRFGSFASGLGAIPGDNGFAKFTSAAAGLEAIPRLLNSPGYRHLTLADAIRRWNGQGANSGAYARQVSQWTGIPLDTRIEDVDSTISGDTGSQDVIDQLVSAIPAAPPYNQNVSSLSGPRSPQDPGLLSPSGFNILSQIFASTGGDQAGILSGNAYSDQGAAKVINDLVTAIPAAPAFNRPGILSRLLGGEAGHGGGLFGLGGLFETGGILGPPTKYPGVIVDGQNQDGNARERMLDQIFGGGSRQSTSTAGAGPLGGILGTLGGRGGLGGLSEGLKDIFGGVKGVFGGRAAAGTAATIAGRDPLDPANIGQGAMDDIQKAQNAQLPQGYPGGNLIGAIGLGLALDGLRRKTGTASALETSLGGAGIGYKLGGAQGAFIGAGIGLAVDGTRRGGVGGILEAAGGGALAGEAIGGPIGAVVGAGIGAGVATIRTLFFESDRDHTKKLVKRIYGFDINDSTADAIINIAKQRYGGAISIAVRSQEVRDLLKLYAETIGNKKAKDQFVGDTVHGASLIESRGQLFQGAVYDNGEAYTYASPLSTYGGIETTPISTSARNSGTVSIGSVQLIANGQSASDLLAGQVSRVSTPGFIQSRSNSAQSASIGRTQQRSLTLSPSALDR
jgi:hypothetical protein